MIVLSAKEHTSKLDMCLGEVENTQKTVTVSGGHGAMSWCSAEIGSEILGHRSRIIMFQRNNWISQTACSRSTQTRHMSIHSIVRTTVYRPVVAWLVFKLNYRKGIKSHPFALSETVNFVIIFCIISSCNCRR